MEMVATQRSRRKRTDLANHTKIKSKQLLLFVTHRSQSSSIAVELSLPSCIEPYSILPSWGQPLIHRPWKKTYKGGL